MKIRVVNILCVLLAFAMLGGCSNVPGNTEPAAKPEDAAETVADEEEAEPEDTTADDAKDEAAEKR